MQDPLAALNQQSRSGGGFQLGPIITFLRKRKWLILGITVCAGVATGLVTRKLPPVYRATASIILDLSMPQYLGAGMTDVMDGEATWWRSRETMETEFRTLRSRSQNTAVAQALCDQQINGKPALQVILPGTDCKSAEDFAKAAPMLQGMLDVTPVRDSRVVELTVRSRDPQFAAMLANTAANVYSRENLQRRLTNSAGATSWLGDEYHQLVTELRTAEQTLIEFKQKNNIVAVSLEDDQNELSARRRKLAEELNIVEVKLIGLKGEREQFESFGKNDPVSEMNPALAKNEVAQKLKELWIEEYGKLIALQGKYLEKHPAVTAQEQRLKLIKEDLGREVDLSRKNFDAQYSALAKQAADLRQALDQATREAIKLEGRSAEYFRLKRDLDRQVKLADQIGGRERVTSLASNIKTNNVRVLDAAVIPSRPVSPDVPKAVLLAIGLGLLLSIGFALLLDALDSTVKTQEDIEQTAGLTFLGLIPSIEKSDLNGTKATSTNGADPTSRELFVYTHPTSQVAECCRAIRTNLLFMSPDRPAKSLVITSAGPQEGKTTVAASLGITMAVSGLRVLLVDTDMRRPRLHKAFALPSVGNGLSSAILGEGNVLSFVRASDVPNLSLLPCGPTPPNPAELLHTNLFRGIVNELLANFDLVIFDSPPLGAVTDAAILARMTEATLLVAKAGRTSKYALNRSRRQLGTDGAVNVLGCVLNDISLSRQREYGYYSYYYYSQYGYYGRGEDQAAKSSGPA